MLESPGDSVVTTRGSFADAQSAALAGEAQILRYLYGSFSRVRREIKAVSSATFL